MPNSNHSAKPTPSNHAGLSRRSVLKSAVAAAVATPYFPWTSTAKAAWSKNDLVPIACIGVGSMGSGDAGDAVNQGAEILAVCDVDRRHAERAANHEKMGKGKAEIYSDYRKVLERDDIKVVQVVTPDHWHVKIAIEALEAGKHVFCQKPLTLTIEENKLIRAACEKHPDLVFGIGTQQRSEPNLFMRAVNMVRKGLLGEIEEIRVCIDGSPTGGPFPVAEVPKELDWEMWQGQAPAKEYRERRCHYEFRWWYEYSGGKFTDWGAHHVDIANWATNNHLPGTGPIEIDGTDAKHPVPFENGFPTVDDCYNTSQDFSVKCKFANGLVMDVTSRGDNGLLITGTEGRIFVNRGKITGKPIEENWDEGKYTDEDRTALFNGKPQEWSKKNFYRCVREGGTPVSDALTHLQTMNTCHLAAIAARLGRVIQWDPAAETIVGDDQAIAMMSRKQREGYEILDLRKS